MSELQYYLRISNHLAGELDIRSALRAVKGEIDQIIDVDHLDVCLIDDEGHANTSYEVGLRTTWSTTRALITVSPIRDILLGNTDAMLTGNAQTDPRYIFPGAYSEPITKHGLKSRVNVAMKVLGRTIGALNCSSRKENYYTEANLAQVQILADILAPYFFALQSTELAKKAAVAKARAETRQEGLRQGALLLTQALEEERQRIGMDLHDQTLGELTGLSRQLSGNLSQVSVENIQSQLQLIIQRLRGIIDASIPSILELFGFEEGVRSHFESVAGADPELEFSFLDETGGALDRLAESKKTAIFRICQEAINNAVRHSAGANLSIHFQLEEDDKHITITVCDDGNFKPAKSNKKGGLEHMKTRADLIGATYELKTNNGTCVTVRLPTPNMEKLS